MGEKQCCIPISLIGTKACNIAYVCAGKTLLCMQHFLFLGHFQRKSLSCACEFYFLNQPLAKNDHLTETPGFVLVTNIKHNNKSHLRHLAIITIVFISIILSGTQFILSIC